MDPKAGALMIGAGVLFAVVGGVVAIIDPPDPPSADTQQANTQTVTQDAAAQASEEPQTTPEKEWVNNVGDYYVSCKITGGIRWYIAINRSDLTDGRLNQTPTDEQWAQMCYGG